jgi:hypothetical protein
MVSLLELADFVKSKSCPWGVDASEGSCRLVGVSEEGGNFEVERVPSCFSSEVAPGYQHQT